MSGIFEDPILFYETKGFILSSMLMDGCPHGCGPSNLKCLYYRRLNHIIESNRLKKNSYIRKHTTVNKII